MKGIEGIIDVAYEAQLDQERAEFRDVAFRAAVFWKELRRAGLPAGVSGEIVLEWVKQCFAPIIDWDEAIEDE